MFTIIYKGVYIHGYIDRSDCRVQVAGLCANVYKSLHAAKIAVTKTLRIPPNKRA